MRFDLHVHDVKRRVVGKPQPPDSIPVLGFATAEDVGEPRDAVDALTDTSRGTRLGVAPSGSCVTRPRQLYRRANPLRSPTSRAVEVEGVEELPLQARNCAVRTDALPNERITRLRMN